MASGFARLISVMVLLLFILLSTCDGHVIQIETNSSFEYHVCGEGRHTLSDGVTLELSSAHHYLVNSTRFPFCLLENLTNLTIRSSSDASSPVKIHCQPQFEGSGFGFFNMTGLQMINIYLTNCGGAIPPTALRQANNTDNSPLYVLPKQKAVLVLNHCSNILLLNVTVANYFGFGILAANLYGNSTIEDLNIISGVFPFQPNGAMFYYMNSQLIVSPTKTTLTLFRASFNRNVNLDLSNTKYKKMVPLIGSPGVSFIFAQNYTVNVTMNRSRSYDNLFGGVSSGAFVLYLNHFGTATLTLNQFDMKNNLNGGLLVHFASTDYHQPVLTEAVAEREWFPLQISESTFEGQLDGTVEVTQYAILPSDISTWITLSNVTFESNLADHEGTCSCMCAKYLYAELAGISVSKSLGLQLTDIIAKHNGYASPTSSIGLFSFKGLREVHVTGTKIDSSIFSDNYGSVIKAQLIPLHLHGNLTFVKNSGLQGAVFHLSELSYMILVEPFNASFINNQAFYYGGVLYSDFVEEENPACVIQYNTTKKVSDWYQNLDVFMNFANNSAFKSGNDIYAYPLYNCTISIGINDVNLPALYRRVFNFIQNTTNNLNQVSSKPNQVCKCTMESGTPAPDCKNEEPGHELSLISTVYTYAGGTVNFSVCGVDGAGAVVYSPVIVHLYAAHSDYPTPIANGPVIYQETNDAHIPIRQQAQQVDEKNCTSIDVMVFSRDPNEEKEVKLTVSLLQKRPSYEILVRIQPCPSGFAPDFNDKGGTCVCDKFLRDWESTISCLIANCTISGRPREAWIGLVNETVAYSPVCQEPEFCLSNVTNVDLSVPDSVCANSRSGVLCGGCQENLSNVLGALHCWKCDNNYGLFSLPFFALAGIVLVVFLIALRITVSSGTIGGLIFYANISQTNILHLLEEPYYIFLHVFISFINLDLGFPLCFFNGMRALHKNFLQFVFPVYLWLIVFMIVAVSHYSPRFSKLIYNISIQVLATVIFLSYSKLLQASLFALIPTHVHYSNHTEWVWFLDGNLHYFSFLEGHGYLGVLAIMTLLFFVLPYTLLVTIGSRLMRYRWFAAKFKPIIDAHHGPYKDRWHFWFGVRLWVMFYSLVVYSTLRQFGSNLVIVLELVVLIPFLFLQAYVQPYKNHLINLLDLFLMTNLTITMSILTYNKDFNLPAKVAAALSVSVTFIVFTVIVAYQMRAVYIGFIKKHCRLSCRYRGGSEENLISPSQSVVTINDYDPLKYPEAQQNSNKVKLRESLLSFILD